MQALLIALAAGVTFIIAYRTYGRWLGSKIFRLAAEAVCPSQQLRDDQDYIPTPTPIVFGHHFTSIAGTGPIVGPAIAIMWGWVPALLWVVFGSIFIGAVHDFGALVVSLRNNGQTVGDIAGRVLNKRVRLLFLFILFMALTVVLAIFGLVIAAVFKQYPDAIFPCVVQIPIAIAIGMLLYRKGIGLLFPSFIALAVMYLTVIFGNIGFLASFNNALADWPIWQWVVVLLLYSYIASVLPVWSLLQPRDYINSLQLISALGLIVLGLAVAAFFGYTPAGGEKQSLQIAAPAFKLHPEGAPMIFPFLFITIACGAISGFHCLVSSGTSSKQLSCETDARFVGYGSMLIEGFLATLVILACGAGLSLRTSLMFSENGNKQLTTSVLMGDQDKRILELVDDGFLVSDPSSKEKSLVKITKENANQLTGLGLFFDFSGETPLAFATGTTAWNSRYESWSSAKGLSAKVGAFVDGSANFLKSLGLPAAIAVALMGVLVASFAGTTLDTACRLQRYVVQELAATLGSRAGKDSMRTALPFALFQNKHVATIFAIVVAAIVAALPAKTPPVGFFEAMGTGVLVSSDGTVVSGSHIADQANVVKGLAGALLWLTAYSGKGGLILWPLFGATNQLLGGLSFLVISFYLWRRKIPVWFIVLPMLFMLVMPAWAMLQQLPDWIAASKPNYTVITIGAATLALEIWMILEAILLWPRVRGILEPQLPRALTTDSEGMNC